MQIFCGVGAGERAAEDGEVLREHEDLAAVDEPVAGDDAVAEDLLLLHAEVGAAVRDEAVELDEAAGVEQEVDALARGQLAGLVLLLDAGLAAAEERLRVQVVEALHVRRRSRRVGSAGGSAERDAGGAERGTDIARPL